MSENKLPGPMDLNDDKAVSNSDDEEITMDPMKFKGQEEMTSLKSMIKSWSSDWDKNQQIIFDQVSEFLSRDESDSNREIRQIAADWMAKNAARLAQNDSILNESLMVLFAQLKKDSNPVLLKKIVREAIRRVWNAGWEEETNQAAHRQIAIDFVLKAIEDSEDPEIRQAAIDYLGETDKAKTIAKDYELAAKVADILDKIRRSDTEPEGLRDRASRSLKNIWDAIKKEGIFNLDVLDEDEKARAIRNWTNENTFGSREAISSLVNKWIEWLVKEEEQRLVELTASELRYNSHAVLPLVENFVKSWEEPQVKERSIIGIPLPMRSIELSQLQQEEMRIKRLTVRQRIARQLADMSDLRFFDLPRQSRKYETIIKELRNHAVPALVRRLPAEHDIEILENISRTLAHTKEREAINALTKEVVGEDRTRNARKELLAKYYLQPSKERSDLAADILRKAIKESKRTLRILQVLNISVFAVGLTVLFAGLMVSMLGNEMSSRIVGGLSAIGGFIGVVVQLVRDPLNRIQRANSNLVQMETAFTSFIWELNLNGTFIQSSYVDNGVLSDADIEKTLGRIEQATELTMDLVSLYTEEGKPRFVTRINKLEPAAGILGSSVTIFGQHLQGDSTEKKERSGVVAINHVPINGEKINWKEDKVAFKIPDLSTENETIWVSLFVDGMETNALPFRVITEAKG